MIKEDKRWLNLESGLQKVTYSHFILLFLKLNKPVRIFHKIHSQRKQVNVNSNSDTATSVEYQSPTEQERVTVPYRLNTYQFTDDNL